MAETDEDLLADAREGNREAFGLLVERRYAAIHSYVLSFARDRALAEDVAQEVFLRAFRSIGRIPDAPSLSGWLFAAARNVHSELHRKGRRLRRLEEAAEVATAAMEMKESPPLEDRHARLLEAVGRLPEGMREVIAMKYAEGIGCGEIAARLGKPVGTVTSLLSRAYHALKRELEVARS